MKSQTHIEDLASVWLTRKTACLSRSCKGGKGPKVPILWEGSGHTGFCNRQKRRWLSLRVRCAVTKVVTTDMMDVGLTILIENLHIMLWRIDHLVLKGFIFPSRWVVEQALWVVSHVTMTGACTNRTGVSMSGREEGQTLETKLLLQGLAAVIKLSSQAMQTAW
jgi:hypothetical protein